MPVKYVHVRFDDGIPEQGAALMEFERLLRVHNKADIRVYKDRMADDSKLRRAMTVDEREKL